MRLINTRTSRYYVTDENGKRGIVHPGQVFEGSSDDADADGMISAGSKQGKAYLDARGRGAEAGDLILSPDEADAEARDNAADRDDDEATDPVLEASQGTDLVGRALATSKIRNPHAEPEEALDEAIELAQADVGDGPVGGADIDPETGENRDNIGEPGEPPTHAADGRPIVDVERDDAAPQDENTLSPDEAEAEAQERLESGEEPPPIEHRAADGGTITASGHPEAIKGAAPAPAPAEAPDEGDGDGEPAAEAPAAVEFTSDKAKAKAKSLKVTHASLEAGKGSGADGKFTIRDIENVAKERREAAAAESG